MSGVIFNVSTAGEFRDAILQARGGDTILMAAGRYDPISVWTGMGYVPPGDGRVTIRSANPEEPAVLSRMTLRNVEGLILENLVFDYQYTEGDRQDNRPFQIHGSSDVTIRDSVFEGAVVNGAGFGFGLQVRNSSDITLENSEFLNWARGALFGSSNNLVVKGNEFHKIKVDGTNFAQVQNVLIENNHFHSFLDVPESRAHRDMIQFWTASTTAPSTDIVIRGNLLDIGEGSWSQSIFMRNELVDSGGAGPEMHYRNILIEDNIIYNGHTHGITVGATDGLVIRQNTVLHHAGDLHGNTGLVTVPTIRVGQASSDVVIERNVVSAIAGTEDREDWHVVDNVFVQHSNPGAPGYYGAHFITSSFDHLDGALKYIVLPGSEIEALGAGASRLLFDYSPESVTAAFQVAGVPGTSGELVFDAGFTMGPTGTGLTEGVRFIWSFGDGTVAEGPLLRHAFEEPGYYEVMLEVIGADGSRSVAQHRVGISGEQIAGLNADRGGFVLHAFGEETLVEVNPVLLVKTDTGSALQLGGEGVQATIPRSALSSLSRSDNFELSLTLQGSDRGEVARLGNVFVTTVLSDGNFQVEFFPDDGSRVILRTAGVDLTDGAVHNVALRFSGTAGRLELLVGGEVVAARDVSGALQPVGGSLVFGTASPNRRNFEGLLFDFDLRNIQTDYLPYVGALEAVEASVDFLVASESLPLQDDVPAQVEEPLEDVEEDTVPEVLPENDTEDEPAEEQPVVSNEAPEDGEDEDLSDSPVPDPVTSPETALDDDAEESPANPVDGTGPTSPSQSDEAAPEEEDHGAAPSVPLMPLLDGFVLDPVTQRARLSFVDDAHVTENGDGYSIHMDGHRDAVLIGQLQQFETSQRLGYSVEFTRDTADGSGGMLVWNHMRMGLLINDHSIGVLVGGGATLRSFMIEDPGLVAGERGRVTILADAQQDRLQVIVNDRLVLDDTQTDIDFVHSRGQNSWSLGTTFGNWFAGEVHDFRVSDRFDFLESPRFHEDSPLIA